MKDEEMFGKQVSGWVRELDPAPETPREEMWARIEQARRFRRSAQRQQPRIGPWIRWGAPLAAALVLGIGIGRFTQTGEAPAPVARDAGVPAGSEVRSAAELPYRMVAVQHLDAAEALLAALPEDARRGRADEVAVWARELLVSTRLLLDSPAAEDPQLARLFQDLELVLAQIASLSGPHTEGEIRLIEDGIQENDVLIRLRAATRERPNAGI